MWWEFAPFEEIIGCSWVPGIYRIGSPVAGSRTDLGIGGFDENWKLLLGCCLISLFENNLNWFEDAGVLSKILGTVVYLFFYSIFSGFY